MLVYTNLVGTLSGNANPGADLLEHINDATDAHDASAISSVPVGGIAAVNVQAALQELDAEKATYAYVDSANATQDASINNRVLRAGDTMSGHLGLPANPGTTQATRRDYVDSLHNTQQSYIDTRDNAVIAYSDAADAAQNTTINNKVNRAGDTMTGNLGFSGAQRRIYGDTSAAASGDRFAFQNSVANGNSVFGMLPNGTSSVSALRLFGTSAPDSAASAHVTLSVGIIPNGAMIATAGLNGGAVGPVVLGPNGTARLTARAADTAASPGVDVEGGVNATRYWEKMQYAGPGAVTLDWLVSAWTISVGGGVSVAFSNLSPASIFGYMTVEVAGNFNLVTWPASVNWGAGGKPSIAGGAVVSLLCRDGINQYGSIMWKGA